jgi:hypothetical protein
MVKFVVPGLAPGIRVLAWAGETVDGRAQASKATPSCECHNEKANE